MSSNMISKFKNESKSVLNEVMPLLEELEGDFSQVGRLADCGQRVDRIMGGARTLAMGIDDNKGLMILGNYGELCKSVCYRGSRITDNETFYDVVVALLLDAFEMMERMSEEVCTEEEKLWDDLFTDNFLDRLRWVAEQFDSNSNSGIEDREDSEVMAQDEVDNLLKAMGFD